MPNKRKTLRKQAESAQKEYRANRREALGYADYAERYDKEYKKTGDVMASLARDGATNKGWEYVGKAKRAKKAARSATKQAMALARNKKGVSEKDLP